MRPLDDVWARSCLRKAFILGAGLVGRKRGVRLSPWNARTVVFPPHNVLGDSFLGDDFSLDQQYVGLLGSEIQGFGVKLQLAN